MQLLESAGRTLHKKDVAEVPNNLVEELFQCAKAIPKNVSKYVKREKKTVYMKNGRFANKGTAGARAYTVDMLNEEKSKEKSALQKRLQEIREKGRIMKKIEREKKKRQEKRTNF